MLGLLFIFSLLVLALCAMVYGAWTSSKDGDNKNASQARVNDYFYRTSLVYRSYGSFVKKYKIDTEWYKFEDYVIRRFRNDHVTGKELFPEIDWDNAPTDEKELKPFSRPPKYLYRVWNEKGSSIRYRIFKDEKEAMEYGIKTYGYNPNTRRPWNRPDRIDEKFVYAGVDETGMPVKYIMDDSGEVFEGKEDILPWEVGKQ